MSIDAKRNADGSYEVYTHAGSRPTGLDPVALAIDAPNGKAPARSC